MNFTIIGFQRHFVICTSIMTFYTQKIHSSFILLPLNNSKISQSLNCFFINFSIICRSKLTEETSRLNEQQSKRKINSKHSIRMILSQLVVSNQLLNKFGDPCWIGRKLCVLTSVICIFSINRWFGIRHLGFRSSLQSNISFYTWPSQLNGTLFKRVKKH